MQDTTTADSGSVSAPAGSPLRELAREIDTRLEELLTARGPLRDRISYAAGRVRTAAGQVFDRRTRTWNGTLEQARGSLRAGHPSLAELQRLEEALALVDEEIELGQQAFNDLQWRRAFLVTNTGGHVHAHRSCSTCFDSTNFEWLVDYAAATQEEIIEAAGSDACTVCYPDAPANVLNRPPELVSRYRAELAARQDALAEARAQRELTRIAKSVTGDGRPLVVPALSSYSSDYDKGGELTNEVTATRLWVDIEVEKSTTYEHMRPGERHETTQKLIVAALARKHQRTIDEQEELLRQKAARKSKQRGR